MDYNLSILENGCREYGISLDERQKQQFIRYYELLVEWNKVMNLTGITEFEEVLLKHFTDSLSIAKAVVQAHRGKLSAAAKGTDRLVITALFPSA